MDVILHQDKFHKIIFKSYRVSKIKKENQTIRNLLCYYQEMACEKYPNEAMFIYILGYNYDAKFKVSLTSFGSYSLIEYTLSAVDPKFINDSNYTIENLKQLFIDACKPIFKDKKADSELFKRVFDIYESDLLSKEDSHQSMALRGTVRTYFKDTDRDYDAIGNLDDLYKIDEKMLYDYYESVCNEETISIVSCLEKDKIDLSNITLKPKHNYHFRQRNKVDKFNFVDADSNQTYLEVIYETKTYANDKLYFAMMFLNYIFGGASSSNLFKIVREKYGLCYAISSMYLGATGIIIVSTILDKKNIEKAIEAFEESLNEIKNGNFDIEEVRRHYVSVYKANSDYQETAISNYLSDNYFLDSPKSTKELEGILSVTKEDISKCAQLLEQTFIYAYGGKNDE